MAEVYYYGLGAFGSIDSRLTDPSFGEIFTGKAGATLTTSSNPTISSFSVDDGNSTFDDVAIFIPQTLTSDVTIDGVTYPAGTATDVGYFMLVDSDGDGVADHTLFSVEVDNVIVGWASNSALPANTTLTAISGGLIGDIAYSDMVTCFTDGAMIKVPDGERAIETLDVGDLVCTARGAIKPILWIGHQSISPTELLTNDTLRPIHISANALGDGVPTQDMDVSRQHRILVSSKIVKRMCHEDEVLVPAKDLLEIPGISRKDDLAPLTYHHIALDQHEILIANGMQTESLYLGKNALKSMPEEQRRELVAIFPELREAQTPVAAQTFLAGKKARKMVERHLKNHVPVQ